MTRSMTPAEKEQFRKLFSGMDVDRVVVTGEATPEYNCVAWTLGVTTTWMDPGSRLEDFNNYYMARGFVVGSQREYKVRVWRLSKPPYPLFMIHASVYLPPGHAESKFGELLRAQHREGELSLEWIPVQYYSHDICPSPQERELIEAVNSGRFSTLITDDHAGAVLAESARLSPVRREQFEEAFLAWKATWSLPHMALSASAQSVTHSVEFQQLVSMGPDIIASVVEKLLEPDNFFALQLYDRLQPARQLTVSVNPASDEVFEGEQGRARRTVQRFVASL